MKDFELNKAITSFKEEDFKNFIKKNDSTFREKDKIEYFDKVFEEQVQNFLKKGKFSKSCVLGFDIYKYSSYQPDKQALIPLIFFMLYDLALSELQQVCPLFKDIDIKKLRNQFISTGDGGFQILPTPIHAIKLLILFHGMLRLFNSGHIFPKLNSTIDYIDIRYAITIDDLYKIEHKAHTNYYGTAIINNARIMGKDKLNRLLIDENTFQWFLINFRGLENMQNITYAALKSKLDFSKCNWSKLENGMLDLHFMHGEEDIERGIDSPILTCDVMKIGKIESKEQVISVYNLYLKVLDDSKGNKDKTIYSIGNMNTGGLDIQKNT